MPHSFSLSTSFLRLVVPQVGGEGDSPCERTHVDPTPLPHRLSTSHSLPWHLTSAQGKLIIQKQDDVLKLEADPMKTDKANEI